jgi:hypothetical protein
VRGELAARRLPARCRSARRWQAVTRIRPICHARSVLAGTDIRPTSPVAVGAVEADNIVTKTPEVGRHRRADVTAVSGDQNAHRFIVGTRRG